MATRPRDRRYVRYIGPADRMHGEFRGDPVEVIEPGMPMWRVRFPDGSVSMVHEDHLTDVIFRMERA